MENLNYELSEYIQLLRFKAKMSQQQVADKLKVSRNTYNTWEQNPIKLDLEKLQKIGDILGEDISIFFTNYVAKRNVIGKKN